jgi:hypothetical protein
MGKQHQQFTEPPVEGEAEDTGYNAGDPAQVGERKVQAKNTENERIEGLRYVMATKQGRAWMCYLLEVKLGVPVTRVTKLFTGNSGTFYNTALRETGDVLEHELKRIAKLQYRLMEDEAQT